MSTRRSGSSSGRPARSTPPRRGRRLLAAAAAVALLTAACGPGSGTADPSAAAADGDRAGGDGTDPDGVDTDGVDTDGVDTDRVDADGPDEGAEGDPGPGDGSSSGDGAGTGDDPGPIDWRECDGGLQCGALPVPLDHDDPAGPSIDVALVRVPATGPPVGSLFVNPGGPGASGIDFVRGGFRLDAETMSRYHLVGFDPRGIGRSSPLACPVDRGAGPLADLSPDTPAEATELDDAARAIAERCLAAEGDRLRLVGTDSVIADLDLLRRAVGDDRLHFYGLSYGTVIGLRYAERHPEAVGHLVLDGVVDPAGDLTDLLRQQAIAFERAFDRLDARCGRELTCPAGGVAASFDRGLAELESSGPVGEVGPAEFELAALIALYSEGFWPTYAAALASAEQGDHLGIEGVYGVLAGGADYAAYAAVTCFDSPHPEGAAAWDAFAADLAAVAPRFGAALANEIRACAHWPVSGDRAPAPVDAAGSDTILVIGTTGDPATPVDNARTVAATLANSVLVVADGDGHTAYGSNACARAVVADYLADRLEAAGPIAC